MVTSWSIIIAQQKKPQNLPIWAKAVETKQPFILMKGDLLIVQKVHIYLCIREKFAKLMSI